MNANYGMVALWAFSYLALAIGSISYENIVFTKVTAEICKRSNANRNSSNRARNMSHCVSKPLYLEVKQESCPQSW